MIRGRDVPAAASPPAGQPMTETMTILASLAPVFLVMALGYWAGHTRDFDSHNIGSLNALVMDFALPAALFTAMAQASRQAMLDQTGLALVLVGAMVAAYGVTYLSNEQASAATGA